MPYLNRPFIVEETPGTKHYCTCGESENKPYCDGAHSKLGTGKFPKEKRLVENKRVIICDCGQSAKAPFCDNAHRKL